MPIAAFPGQGLPYRPLAFTMATLLAAGSAHAADAGKAACMPDAKRLCAAEVNALSRTKVRACLIAHIDQTAPVCHDFMVKARAEALSGRKPDSSAQ